MVRNAFRDAAVDAATEGFCQILAGQAAAARLFVDTREDTPLIGGPLALPARIFSAAYTLACGELPTPETLDPGFAELIATCPENYLFVWRYQYRTPSGSLLDTTSQNPIPPGPGNGPILGPFGLPVLRAGSTTQWTIIDGNGNETSTWANLPAGGTFEFNELTVQRTDGGMNDCPAPTGPPPLTPPERTINLPITVGADTVNVDVTLGAPIIGAGGVLVAPVTLVGPDFDYDIELNLSTGQATFNFGGGGEGPDCCPEDDEGDRESKILRGVVVTIVSATPNRYFNEIPIASSPPIYGPYVGLLRFWRDTGSGLVYSSDIPVKTTPQRIDCPWEGGADGFLLDNQTDAVLQGRPFFAKVRTQNSEQP